MQMYMNNHVFKNHIPIFYLIAMKLSIILILVSFLTATAEVLAQKVDLKVKNASLKSVLMEISKQSGYAFVFDETEITRAAPVSLQVKGQEVSSIFPDLFSGQPFTYEVRGKVVNVVPKRSGVTATSENVVLIMAYPEVRGRVVDSLRRPLQGATVRVKGYQMATKTDRDGAFVLLNIPDDAVLEITYLGYVTQEVKASTDLGTLVLHVALSDLEEVEVMVNTGYQQLPKEQATGSFEHIDNELFNRQISQDVISRLDGLVPGMLFDKRGGNMTAFNIRGLSTISPLIAQPLIIVDDFPYEGDIANLNPNDVESVTLLKDAAAASIWGTRAGNGVLVITTKKGKLNKPFSLSATSNISMQDQIDLYYEPQMSPSDFIDIEQFLFDEGAFNSALANTITWPFITPAVEIMEQQRQGLITADEANRQLNILKTRDLRRDLTEYVYQKPVAQQYALNLNGGNDRIAYLLSGGYDQSTFQQAGNGNRRITLRSQNTFRPIRNLEVQSHIQYANSLWENNGLGTLSKGGGQGTIYPYARLVDDDGNPAILEQDYRLGFVDTAGQGRLLDWHYRPLEEIDLADNTSRINDFLLNLSAKYRIVKSLTTEVRYQYQHQHTLGRNYQSDQTYYTRNQINRFTQIVGNNIVRPLPLGGILRQEDANRYSHNIRGQLNFDESWGSEHQLAVLLGGEIRQVTGQSQTVFSFGYDDELMIAQPVDMVNQYPIYGGIGFNGRIGSGPSYYGTLDRFVSAFANASYTFRANHLLTASARRDASNLFGVATNNKWKPLWSVGYKWGLSNETFYDIQWLPNLSLRATYGHSGNVNNSVAAVTTIRYTGVGTLGRYPSAIIQNPPNADLRWENVSTVNLASDFGIVNNVLSGSIEYYQKLSTDLITSVPANLTTGFTSLTRNAAQLRTTGWDISLNSTNIAGVFSWNSNFFLSLNKTTITKYLLERSRASGMVGNGTSLHPIEGHDAYNIVSYRWGGLHPETGNPRAYVNGELSNNYVDIINNATEDDLVFHGSARPRIFGALRNTWGYNGITVSANITYRMGYFFRRPTINYVSLLNNGVVAHGDYYKRWERPGDEQYTTVPSMVYPADSRRDEVYRDSEATVEKGSHIRLQDVNLSYRVDKSTFSSLPVRSIVLTLYARNLPILWRANDANIDPDFRGFPAPLNISMGLNINF